ncbi:MAG: hypothetical protein IKO40_08255 [Kiritimatiellae bacterium]|nr:hypothetical protein [Kiritimatiellia bacterium]
MGRQPCRTASGRSPADWEGRFAAWESQESRRSKVESRKSKVGRDALRRVRAARRCGRNGSRP